MTWTKTKTAVLVGIVVAVAAGGIVITKAVKAGIRHRQAAARATWAANVERWRKDVWPGERAQAVERIKAGQAVNETTGAVTIDLTPYTNTKLTEAPLCWKGNNANNLAELPAGTNIFAGVPFDVEGAIYLTGGWLKNHYHKKYPAKLEGIRIDRRCSKIYLLHCAGYVLYQPDVTLASVDYISSETMSVPVMVGLTVE
jgi:hypothetical protein